MRVFFCSLEIRRYSAFGAAVAERVRHISPNMRAVYSNHYLVTLGVVPASSVSPKRDRLRQNRWLTHFYAIGSAFNYQVWVQVFYSTDFLPDHKKSTKPFIKGFDLYKWCPYIYQFFFTLVWKKKLFFW